MAFMFMGASSLTTLDLSGWSTTTATQMNWMFLNANSLRQITLGENFRFGTIAVEFPDVPNDFYYTGRWQNVGNGTIDNPRGVFTFTSEQLTSEFNANTVAGETWVWQKNTVGFVSGTVGVGGAPWRLYSDGTLMVDEGFINWDRALDAPWDEQRDYIKKLFSPDRLQRESLCETYLGDCRI